MSDGMAFVVVCIGFIIASIVSAITLWLIFQIDDCV